MSVKGDRSPLTELLWTAWGALGLSSWSRQVGSVVDPEALIVATAVAGDQRLYLESIDWGIENAPLVMPARLNRFAASVGASAMIDQWIGTVAAHATTVRWNTREAAAMPDFERSRKSAAPDLTGRAAVPAAALRLRSVMGAVVRTEVVRAMHVVAVNRSHSLSNGDVARIAGVASNQSKAVLEDLATAGFLIRNGTPKRRHYAPVAAGRDPMADGVWGPWRALPYAPWHLAPVLVSGLAHLSDFAASAKPHTASIEAAAQLEAVARSMGELDPSFAKPTIQGSSVDVLRGAGEWADTASRRVFDILTSGEGMRGVPPAQRRVTTDAHHNPWSGRPFG